MSKVTDYSTTVIYKISCKDSNITDTYVGSTTSFDSRKQSHKNGARGTYDQTNLYRFIKANGGWDNFEMSIIESYPCKSNREKIERETQLIHQLKPSLNTRMTPLFNQKEVVDKQAKITCACGSTYKGMNQKDHIHTDKHRRYLETLKPESERILI